MCIRDRPLDRLRPLHNGLGDILLRCLRGPRGHRLGEQVLLRVVGEPGHPHPEQPHPARRVHGVQQPRRRLADDHGVVRGPPERLGAGQGGEVVAPHLQHDGPPGQPGLAQPPHAPVGQPLHLQTDPQPVVDVHVVRVLHRHRLGLPLGHHGPLVPGQGHGVQRVPVRLAEQPDQLVLAGLRQLLHRGDPGPAQMVTGGRSDPRQGAHRHRRQQRPLRARLDEHQAVRLGLLGGDLREHLGGGEPHRSGEPGDRPDVRAQLLPGPPRRLLVPGRSPGLQVHERLVQTQRLDQR